MDLTLCILLLSFIGMILHVNYSYNNYSYFAYLHLLQSHDYLSHVQLQYRHHNPHLIPRFSCQHAVLKFET